MKLAAITAVCVILALASVCWVQHARIATLQREAHQAYQELARIHDILPPGTLRALTKNADRHKLRNELNQLREDVELIRKVKGTNLATFTNSAGQVIRSGKGIESKPILEDPNILVNRILEGERGGLAGLSDLSREGHSQLSTNNALGFDPFTELRAAFVRLGQAAGAGDLNALNALWRATRDDYLTSLAVTGLGEAAALGQEDAMEMLLNPAEFGLLESSAMSALTAAAQNLNQRAIEAIAAFAYQPENSALWLMAARALEPAAVAGNEVATEALLEIASTQGQAADAARQALERAAAENQPEAFEALQVLQELPQTASAETNQNF